MKTLRLKTHTQFGDHCTCYGFVNEFSKDFDRIFLLTKQGDGHVENIKRVYSSIKNVIVTPGLKEFDREIMCDAEWYRKTSKWYLDPNLELEDESLIFDRHWYKIAGVDFNKKWEFFFERDHRKEKEIYYDVLGLKDGDEYTFLHDDHTRNFIINRKHINKNIRLVESSKLLGHSILDMLMLVEKAKEVHVINSSFLSFIDLMKIEHNNLNYHKYTRPCPVEQPALRLKWKII